jgi:hypothetical protein
MSLNCRHQRTYYSSPRWYTTVENRGRMMMSTGKLTICPPRDLSQFYQQRHLVASRRNRWKEWEFSLGSISLHTCTWFFACCKILWHVSSGLLPLWRKVYYGFLSPLKVNHLSRVSTCKPWVQWQTLTFTPLRWHSESLSGLSRLLRKGWELRNWNGSN